jgi:hypothetical protein
MLVMCVTPLCAVAAIVDQAHEDVLERALRRMQIAKTDAGRAERGDQLRDARVVALRVVGVDERGAVGRAFEPERRQLGRHRRERLLQLHGQLLLAELAHQFVLVFDEHELAAENDADAVGHFLGFLDVVGGQQDRHAAFAQRIDQLPHVAAQLDVDAGGRLVEEQDARLVRQRLRDHHAALHAARQRHQLVVALVPQRQRLQRLLDVRGIGRLAEQAAAERHRRPDGLERIGRQFLRHEPDHFARRAVVIADVVAADRHAPFGRRDDAADRADQRGLARAVRPEQREDLAGADVEVHVLERLEAGRVSLGEVGNGGSVACSRMARLLGPTPCRASPAPPLRHGWLRVRHGERASCRTALWCGIAGSPY